MEKIRVQCPHCKVILAVSSNLRGSNIVCPKCKTESTFDECERKYKDTIASVSRTVLSSGVIDKPGFLRDMTTGKSYILAEGVNLIGRMTYQAPPKATVPIVTADAGFSRAHLNIRVVKGPDGSIRSVQSLRHSLRLRSTLSVVRGLRRSYRSLSRSRR